MAVRLTTSVAAIVAAFVVPASSLGKSAGVPQPQKIARIARAVFGSRAATAECIAHYESTDGAYLYNGSSLGPWQIDVSAHPWVNGRRLITDWWYAAKVAYRLSAGGRDWHIWGTHADCGV